PQTGLYCYLLAGIAYAVFGTSRQAAIGPTSAISILVGATLGGLAVGDASHYLALAGLTAILVGVVSVVAWGLQLGEIVHFISDTVLTGFKAGVALQIASTQLPKLLGVRAAGSGFFGRMADLVVHVGDTHLLTLLVGGAGILLLIEAERRFPSRPTIL